LIEELWSTIGLKSSDQRLHKLAAAMFEMQMLKIVNEMKNVQQSTKTAGDAKNLATQGKQTFTFDDLQKSMSEFGVCIRRPPFLSEKTALRRTAIKSSKRDD
jgi:hypothetical protein